VNILLAGGSGQLGQELSSCLGGLGRVIAVDRVPGGAGSVELDLAGLGQVETLLGELNPAIVINAAAFTAVDQAETDRHTAFRLNAELPACLARWCRHNDSLLLHYSTDYVFDGQAGRPYVEDDRPGPLNVYGETKLAGEWAVLASGCRRVILRTSWVYSSHGSNFVLSMLRLARQRSELSVVSDQTGCPTWARNLARTSITVIEKILSQPQNLALQGVFHYCDASVVNWYDFARLVFEQAAALQLLHEIPRLKSIGSKEYPQAARRPEYSVLDTSLLRRRFGVQPPELNTSLLTCLQELVA
jgi:dTDP-4-dehydrorhamnose reductase